MLHEGLTKNQLESLQAQVAYAERLKHVTNRIHSAKDLDQLFIELQDEIRALFDAERLALYAVDYDKKEVYSRFSDLDKIREIRVPLGDQSIVGFVARNCVKVNIANAYDKAELAAISPTLAFDGSWDQRSGLRTRQVLTVPVYSSAKVLTGVVQLINKRSATQFTQEDEAQVEEIAQILGIALHNQYQLARRKPTRFDGLITANLLTLAELEGAITTARETQRPIEAVLLEDYHISRRDLGQALSVFYRCSFFEPDGQVAVPQTLLKNINLNYLRTNYWIPLRATEKTLDVLIDDPSAFQKVQDIKRLFPRHEIKFILGLRDDIERVLNALGTERASDTRKDAVATILNLGGGQRAAGKETLSGTELDENANVIIRLVNHIILDAYKMGASDIHIEPYGEKQEMLIRFRIDGRCHQYQRVSAEYRRPLASRLKIMAHLDIAERRKPQDGKIKFALPEREIELRVATLPTAGTENEDVVLRLLASSEPIPLDHLAMSERNLRTFKELLQKPYGLILCVGPTGSGKTTTLHSALQHINTPERKIWTAEDPVEITQYGLRQVQVHPKIGFGFAAAMRAFLRADPDVIMVGEIRDRETAEIAIEASLTGHLVFSTLHTNSAAETVTRLLEMRMDPFNFADALLGVLAQRLARTLCVQCKEQYRPTKEEHHALAVAYGEEAFARLHLPYDEKFVLSRAKGCETCHKTGYKGRMGVHEFLVSTEEIKNLIHARTTAAELFKVATAQGMTTLMQDGIHKCLQGWMDYKQVQAVTMR
jgi:type II secretory ATPase GspE/PulE/Tfp pilus assembly ATPase PilB-like protein